MKRVLAGLDGRVGSRRAVEWAAAVASATRAELHVIYAFRPGIAEGPAKCHAELLAAREADVASWLGEVDDVSVTIEALCGDARPLIRDLAAQREVDLLVVGRQGTSGKPGFLHLGSVAEYLGHHATVPLAVIPAESSARLERFVLGVNGSGDSLAAARWCAPLAAATRSTVWAVCAPEALLRWAPEGAPMGWVANTQHNLIEDWTVDLARAGVVVKPVAVAYLHPADALLATASDVGAELVVVGMRGLGGFPGLRAGGVALRVLHEATIPIVLVPGRRGPSS
jgi:nucleotide-binding universal stress UspA family protein